MGAKPKTKVGARARLLLVLPVVGLPLLAFFLLARSDVKEETNPGKSGISSPATLSSGKTTVSLVPSDPRTGPGEEKPAPPSTGAASGPSTLAPASARALADLRQARGQAREVFERILAERSPLADAAFVESLLALAREKAVDLETRCIALDLVGRSTCASAATVEALRLLAVAGDLEVEARSWAIIALRRLAIDRPDLGAPMQEALLSALENAPSPQARASLLPDGEGGPLPSAIKADQASDERLARLGAFLTDRDPIVRRGMARVFATPPSSARASAEGMLLRALAEESDPDPAAALVASIFRAGGAEAEPHLAKAQEAPIVRSTPALARRVAAWRNALARGETDVDAIMSAAR